MLKLTRKPSNALISESRARRKMRRQIFFMSCIMLKNMGWRAMTASSQVPSCKKVLITGASGALGRKMVEKFSNEGFEVIGTRSSKSHQKTVEIQSKDKVQWFEVDLTCPAEVRKFASHVGSIDALLHCAGGFRFSGLVDLTDSDLDFLINTNLKSAFYLAREFVPVMKKQNFGRIIFISSKATLQPNAGFGAYAASKAGLNALTSSLAAEVLDYDITVNALLPTVIDTEANRKDMPDANFEKWVRPEQLADIALSLVRPLGNPINGALIPVSGRL